MSLKFIYGDGNHDHQQAYIRSALTWLEHSAEHQVFFLVPNYNKFEQEQTILQQLKKAQGLTSFSTIRSQVFSFQRLAWYYLQQTGLLAKESISEVGQAMMMRKTLQEIKSQLKIYQGEIDHAGFIEGLLQLYQELKLGNIPPTGLPQIHGEKPAQQDQRLKFADLSLIFTNYETSLLAKNIQTENTLGLLQTFLQQGWQDQPAPDLGKTLFIITGFAEFNAQEFSLLTTLMTRTELQVALLLDQKYPSEAPETLDLFHSAGKTYYRLAKFARENHVQLLLDQKAPLASKKEELVEVARFWQASQKSGRYQPSRPVTSAVTLWKAVDPEEELRQVARQIRQLITADPTLRYKDIQLLTNDPVLYGQLLPRVFTEAEIPFYIDQAVAMEQHPLVEFLQALSALPKYNFRLTDIFRLLKTELYLPPSYLTDESDWQTARDLFRRQVDLTENVCLKFNFQGSYWQQEKDWRFVMVDEEELTESEPIKLEMISNRVRQVFRQDIASFLKKLARAKTGEEAVTQLYRFLLTIGVDQQLLNWRNENVAAGQLNQARNHEQTWSALMNLMDEYQQIYGSDPFDLSLFQLVFETGLSSADYGKIPTAIDQVALNRLDLARPNQAKITFALGLDDQNFPQQISPQGLLTNEDRQQLNQHLAEDQFLKDHATEAFCSGPFNAYQVFLSATEKLSLSYAVNFDTQKNRQLSPYLKRMKEQLQLPLKEYGHLTIDSPPQEHITSFRLLIGQITRLARDARQKKQPLPAIWRHYQQQLLTDQQLAPQIRFLAKRVLASLDHQNQPVSLSPQLAEKLYGKDIYASVSRLEDFYQCEYKYFANFGLRLKERAVYGLNPLITGDLFHEALDSFLQELFKLKKTLPELSDLEREQLMTAVLQDIFGELRFAILSSSARMNYLKYQLRKTINKVAWALQKQSQRTRLTPIQTEVLFGQIAGRRGIDGLEFPLANEGKLYVRGKIDRVDQLQIGDETYLSVVDYKSSGRQFDLSDAYYGTAMQLLTYLDVVLLDAVQLVGQDQVKAAGAYYLQVHNPTFSAEALGKSGRLTEDLELKEFQYNGLFLQEEKLLAALDDTLEPKDASVLFPIKQKADGQTVASKHKDNFFTPDDLLDLRKHNRRKMQQAADAIVTGEIKLNPTLNVSNKQRACSFCPFKKVCGFDVMLPENDYQRLTKLDKKTVLERLREEREDE